MVADFKFKLEDVLAQHLLLDDLELRLVEQDIADLRQVLHGDVVAVGSVVQHLQRHPGRAYEASHAGLYHFPVERSRHLFALVFHEFLGIVAVLVVPSADFVVLPVNLFNGLAHFEAFLIGLGRPVDSHAV